MIKTGWRTGSIPIDINNPDPNIPAIRYSHMNQNTHLGGPLRIRTDIERKIEMGLVMRIMDCLDDKMQGAQKIEIIISKEGQLILIQIVFLLYTNPPTPRT